MSYLCRNFYNIAEKPIMPRLLVKHRKVLFALMALLAIASALAIPMININTDMTRYMPDDYPMKQGLDLMEEQLPALQDKMQEFGTLFACGEDQMPTDLPQTLALGVGLLFVVLLVMCSSVMEVGLFLVATGFAVVLNMGTNALLPSVSMITNTLTPVLQMVLSMDYSIILMNRYRQEKASGKAPEAAMEGAIGGAASSILSSALTTIVSLMMLCFIKLKIGADLGIVLSKGVSFSLLCNFTVLPFLIIAFDKAVEATQKKVPTFPASHVSSFAYRFRYPLAALFLLVFASFAYLQQNTPLTFAPKWESNALAEASDESAALLLYPNSQDEAVPALMDTIVSLPYVHQGISYPSLVQRRRTVEEMSALFSEFAPQDASTFPTDMLSLVYYARFNPQRTERMSFNEMMDLVEEFSQQGLIPSDFDQKLDINALIAPSFEPVPQKPESLAAAADTDTILVAQSDDTIVSQADSVTSLMPTDNVVAIPEAMPTSRFSYEEVTTALTAPEMARLLQFNEKQIAMVYRMAGKRNKTMTPKELLDFVRENILSNKRYSAFVSSEMVIMVHESQAQIDSILAAGPMPVTPPAPTDTLVQPELADTLSFANPELVAEAIETPSDTIVEATLETTKKPIIETPPSPIEILAEMAFSSMRYTSEQVYSALSAAGFSVPQEQLELLFLYSGARNGVDSTWKMSPEELLDYVADTLLTSPALGALIPDSARDMITEARAELLSGVGQLRGENYSGAVILNAYPAESDSTFAFVDKLRALSDNYLTGPHYWIGESEMYKELMEGFPQELLLLTLLTILSIFIIVAITFRSVFIPIPLVMTIMAGVYVNIWASGIGGNSMYYLSYLIIQGILMGATIDYTILFTHYYLASRRQQESISGSLAAAYRYSSHSILTSGLILAIVPLVMSFVMKDPMIASILWSLSIGAFSIIILILFVLPGVIATLDPLMKRHFKA